MLSPARVAAVVALTAVVHAGCSGPCKKVARVREAAAIRPAPAIGPHLRLRIPFAAMNGVVAEVVAGLPALPIAGDGGGPAGAVLRELTVAVREVRLGPASSGQVHVDVQAEVRIAGATLVTLAAGADLEPAIERDGDEVAIVIGLSSIPMQQLERGLSRGLDTVGDKLVGALSSRLKVPRLALGVAVAELESKLVSAVSGALLPAVRELVSVEIALPPIPVASIDLTSTTGAEGALELGIVTSLPVRASVPALEAPLAPGTFELAISGSALAELANWAIAAGRAPARYDRSLKPDADGDYLPRFDWRAGHERPLVVHVDRVADGCEWFTVGVTPTLAVKDGRVIAGASERKFERVLGPAYIHVAVWLKELLQRAVSRRVAAAARVTIGGRRVEAHLVDAVLTSGEGLRAAATFTIAPPDT